MCAKNCPAAAIPLDNPKKPTKVNVLHVCAVPVFAQKKQGDFIQSRSLWLKKAWQSYAGNISTPKYLY